MTSKPSASPMITSILLVSPEAHSFAQSSASAGCRNKGILRWPRVAKDQWTASIALVLVEAALDSQAGTRVPGVGNLIRASQNKQRLCVSW